MSHESAPVGRRIVVGAGEISFAGRSDMRVDSKHRKRLQMRQLNVEEFARLVAAAAARGWTNTVVVPLSLAKAIVTCAENGVRPHQGRGGTFRSQADETADETAMREAGPLARQYLAEAKATGEHRNPRNWAREKAAQVVRQKMYELGMTAPPSVSTIMRRKY
jgi:hypothetical protein